MQLFDTVKQNVISGWHFLSWANSKVSRPMTACLCQSQLIISLMIWALDICPGQMRAGKCTLSAVCINLPFQLRLKGEQREEKERWGNYRTQMCVIGGSLGSQGYRVQRKADYCSPSGQAFINKHGESSRRHVLVWLAYHTAYRHGTYHITARPSSERTEVTCTGLLSIHLCSLGGSSGRE